VKEAAPPGGWPKPPRHWPEGVRVDIGRPVWWLPEGWGQGIKTTCASKLMCFISPEGKAYYHKHVVKEVAERLGQQLREPSSNPHDHVEWAQKRARIAIQEGKTLNRTTPKFVADTKLFAELDKTERRFLPGSGSDLYFAVVSARRAEDERGLRSLVSVQAQLRAGGADPTWYVDTESLQAYKSLGLRAKLGGKLVPSRNLALQDAVKAGKPCVQVSDDISRWDYYIGELTGTGDMFSGNEAAKVADRLRVSPVAAARFLVAKLRAARFKAECRAKVRKAKGAGARAAAGPRLAGVFPLGNTGQAFSRDSVSTEHFILGDFFVADSSPARFDPRMTLKEDYDYTCAHLQRHGSVLRCNRMFVSAVHETNSGGACSERDAKGEKERANIRILREKWPGVFMINGKRGDTQVVMCWRRRPRA